MFLPNQLRLGNQTEVSQHRMWFRDLQEHAGLLLVYMGQQKLFPASPISEVLNQDFKGVNLLGSVLLSQNGACILYICSETLILHVLTTHLRRRAN